MEIVDPPVHFACHGLNAVKGRGRRAATLFESRHPGHHLRCRVCRVIASLSQAGKLFLRACHLCFQLRAPFLVLRQLLLLFGNEVLPLVFFPRHPLHFALVNAEPLAHARHLVIELAQGVAAGHGELFGFAAFAFQTIEQRDHFRDFASQSGDAGGSLAHGAFQFRHLPQHVAQFALHRERPLAALLAAGNHHIVETLAGLRKEESVRVFQGKRAADAGIGNDIAVAQLRQNHFQRLAKAVEHANAVL